MADVTLGQMKTEIADEIARTDLTSQIETAILDTLLIYGQQRFLFNSEVTETYTDEGVGYVPIPSGSFSIESIKVEESDTITRQLEYQSYRSLDRADNDPTYTNTPFV
ncbi:MAG: hypothetical protein AMJ43_08000 [Coxiella sp. DG_40]|nr:MAG: hypothetical protein AMJ43_08000 [Coxiella sp. DG_40]